MIVSCVILLSHQPGCSRRVMQTTIPSLTVRTHHQATNNSHRKKQWLHWVRRRRPQDQEHLHRFTQDHHHRVVWRWDKSILKIATQGNFQAQKKTKQTSYNGDKVFIFEEELKFFEAITKSFEAKIGNPEICQAVVIEQPNQRRELLRELANLVKTSSEMLTWKEMTRRESLPSTIFTCTANHASTT